MWCPLGKIEDSAQIFLDNMKKYPPDKSIYRFLVPIGASTTRDGVYIITVLKVKRGRYEDALSIVNQLMLGFSKLEGFSYEIKTLMDGPEAMELLGLKMPENL